MARFTARNVSEAVVAAERQAIWKVLVDPPLLARLTPLVESITADGDHWTWRLVRIPVLSTSIAPAFTERMTFHEGHGIEFTHDPPAGGKERAGVEGSYHLDDAAAPDGSDGPGTALAIDLEITVDLPLPRASGPAVRTVMGQVVTRMGDRFSHNLHDHLGIPEQRRR